MMNVDVSGLLSSARAKRAALPAASAGSDRPLEPEAVDTGLMLLVEANEHKIKGEDDLKIVARDNAQLLINALFRLPTSRVDEVTVVKLPPPEFVLPREKPAPKPKPPTKWEKYAKEKGIQKKTKTRLVWDDVVNEWVPRFGFKKVKAEEQKNWVMEIKDNADPMQDPFEKARTDKRERVAKNELQRLRNIARTKNVKVPGVGLTPVAASAPQTTSTELSKAADLAKKSTASLGKFQRKLPTALDKQEAKSASSTSGKKRKFEPLISTGEKERSLKLLEQMNNKRPKLDVSKAVGRMINAEETERAEARSERPRKGGKGGGKGGRKGGKGAKGGKKGGGAFAEKKSFGGGGKKVKPRKASGKTKGRKAGKK